MAPPESPSPSATVSRRPPVAFVRRGPPPHVVVWLRGEHDGFTVHELVVTMARAITLGDAELVVDLSGVEFMGAATAGVLIRSRALLRTRSRSLVLRSPSRSARHLLDLCDLAGLVDPRLGDPPTTDAHGRQGSWVTVPDIDGVERCVAPSPLDRFPETVLTEACLALSRRSPT
jgi:anti-anti-sigma factor